MGSYALINVLQLQDLGRMCGLMPDMTQSEDQKQAMDTLLAGIGKTQEGESLPSGLCLAIIDIPYIDDGACAWYQNGL